MASLELRDTKGGRFSKVGVRRSLCCLQEPPGTLTGRAAGNTLVGVMGSTPAKRTMFLQKRRKNTVYIYFGATGNK